MQSYIETDSAVAGDISTHTGDKRIRTLTEKGAELYEVTITKYGSKLDHCWKLLAEILAATTNLPSDIRSVELLQSDLENCSSDYFTLSSDYLSYLLRTGTLQSLSEVGQHNARIATQKLVVENAKRQLATYRHAIRNPDSVSQYSSTLSSKAKSITGQATVSSRSKSCSHKSGISNVSSLLVVKRAKAVAARARMEFAAQETEIRKQRAAASAVATQKMAELDADLDYIAQEKEAVAAEAEADALQLDDDLSSDLVTRSAISERVESFERTQDYVAQHAIYRQSPVLNDTYTDPHFSEINGQLCSQDSNVNDDQHTNGLLHANHIHTGEQPLSLDTERPVHVSHIHTGEQPLSLDTERPVHANHIHTGEQPLPLDTERHVHVSHIHTGEQPLPLDTERSMHANHIHTGEQPVRVNHIHTGEQPLPLDTERSMHANHIHTGEQPLPLDTERSMHANRIHTGEQPSPHYVPVSATHLKHAINIPTNADAPAFVYGAGDVGNKQPFYPSPFDQFQSPNVELNRYLFKKDLLMSRLTHFNDKPENYMIWRSSFTSVMTELRVSPSEELDLLVKWLGNESTKYAISIRASNANNPEVALHRLWERMNDRYGCPEMVEDSLKRKLTNFPKLTNRDYLKLYELSDLLCEIESVKEDQKFNAQLAYYDTSAGVKPIVCKLPYQLQEKWTGKAVEYKRRNGVTYPPFSVFCEFIRDMSKVKNDPSFTYDAPSDSGTKRNPPFAKGRDKSFVATKKTEVKHNETRHVSASIDVCPIHKTKHALNKCMTFRNKTIEDRRKLMKDNKICFRCCNSYAHLSPACHETIHCETCGSDRHPAALHVDNYRGQNSVKIKDSQSPQRHGGERNASQLENVSSNCTQICGSEFSGKSCAKVVLVNVYEDGHPENATRTYAILDEQSNRSLAKTDLFNGLDLHGQEIEYTLSSCAGNVVTSGRQARDCIVETLDGGTRLRLPTLIECNQIPEIREEIPSPEIAEHYLHLNDIIGDIPPVEQHTPVLLLIGRDLPEAHHVLDQRIGLQNSPYAQRLNLGWVIVGETCLGKVHTPKRVNVNKTHLLANGRSTLFEPCPNSFEVIEDNTKGRHHYDSHNHKCTDIDSHIGASLFEKTRHDDKPGMSVDDNEFIEIMDKEFHKNEAGNWEAPLPFRADRPRLPNNRQQAVKRAKTLDYSLKKYPNKKEHFLSFMQGVFDAKHAELAPPLGADEECWYLPIFGVYHPKKPNQIRAVLDSSAKHNGVSLNDVLLTGPVMTNSLLGVLLRFRREAVAVTTDIQQMFHCFYVNEAHRNYLRFLWYKDNDPDNALVEYRMCVHVFGNGPSPAIATLGLRKTAEDSVKDFGEDVKTFVDNDFYVDDGLTSRSTAPQVIDLLKRTQDALQSEGNLRLHKIASNNDEVRKAFPVSDLAKDLQQLYLDDTDLPLQRSLGLVWDINSDSFTFQVSGERKPYTRRGLLSTVNSLFDPLGFVAPVTIQGKLLLRGLMTESRGWDESLPTEYEQQWIDWRDSLCLLQDLHVPRTYSSSSLSDCVRREVHLFSDASEQAIAAVAYLKTTSPDGAEHVGYIMGKAKVAPKHGHTIPRLELCAAVLAAELSETILDHMGIEADLVRFYTDSKVVLGYINNRTRRFYVYVSNRLQLIHKYSKPEQWNYIPTNMNPADCATRPSSAATMDGSLWLKGPAVSLLHSDDERPESTHDIVNADEDNELRPVVDVLKTHVANSEILGSRRFERFSIWSDLVETIARLKHVAQGYHNTSPCKGWHACPKAKTVDSYRSAEHTVIRAVQREVFNKDLECIADNRPLPGNSPLRSLDPVVDDNGVLRVGGRLSRADISTNERNPIIIPAKHHIATLLVRHHHGEVKHQGRHFTEGAIRSAGLWIIGAKRLISSVIHTCVKCRKLRGKFVQQKMSDLPSDRVTPGPPFSSVGVDTFGPWTVISRRTRGGQANKKRWGILFTCLTTRAVHIEVVEELSSSSFINALRRFVAIRGEVKVFRSDCGTNFVGATDSLNIEALHVEVGPVKDYLYKTGTVWLFNSPHASHMGGAWERMIGVTRKILDSMLSDVTASGLTHEVLITLMAEVTAIINARPIVSVSSDPENPEILTPSTLLTQKSGNAPSLGQFDLTDMYKAQWKRVQILADTFWCRWRREYLQTLQCRRKWHYESANLRCGDVVLLMDSDVCRNDWPVGAIINSIPSEDGKVRKAEVRVIRDGKPSIYTRPVTKMVLLVANNEIGEEP